MSKIPKQIATFRKKYPDVYKKWYSRVYAKGYYRGIDRTIQAQPIDAPRKFGFLPKFLSA